MGDSNASMIAKSDGTISLNAGTELANAPLSGTWSGEWVTAVGVFDGASSKLVVTNGTDEVEVTGNSGSGNIVDMAVIAPSLVTEMSNSLVYDIAQDDTNIDAIITYLNKYL